MITQCINCNHVTDTGFGGGAYSKCTQFPNRIHSFKYCSLVRGIEDICPLYKAKPKRKWYRRFF